MSDNPGRADEKVMEDIEDNPPGYRRRVIDHFRDDRATKEDWLLLSQIFFEISVLGTISDDISLDALNKRIGPPVGIMQ